MRIEILCPECPRCAGLDQALAAAARELGLAAELELRRVSDPTFIIARGVWRPPGLAIDGVIVSRGKVLDTAAVLALVRAAHERTTGGGSPAPPGGGG